MGMPLDPLTLDAAVARVVAGLDAGRGGSVLTPNLDVLRQHRRSGRLQQAFRDTDLLVADGVPLIWASRLQGRPLPQRITGSDMLWSVARVAAERGDLLFLAGGRPGVPQRAAERLTEVNPGLRTAARDCFVGPGPLAPQVEGLVEDVVAAAPRIVYVGLPFASQVDLIAELRARLPAAWFLGIGSCFDFVNGDRPRAPVWLQRIGLEWAHRVFHEPHVWRRYLVQGLPFAARLGVHSLAARATARREP
jgi:N-acetylglucosaminyldiphosphoundecaprenol N-acetyl-beta-D-mannosaminyltransferase